MTSGEEDESFASQPAKKLGKNLPRQKKTSSLLDEITRSERQRRGQQKLLFWIVSALVCLSFLVTGGLVWMLGKGKLDLPPTGQVAAIAAFGAQPFLLIRGLTLSVYRASELKPGDSSIEEE